MWSGNMEQELLLRKSLSSDNIQRINSIQSQIKPLLSRTTNINFEFTEHTLDHSLSVENLYGVCFHEVIEELNEDEKFLLIVATLVHDIGMVGNSRFKDNHDYAEEIRSGHNYRSGEFISEYRRELGLDTKEASAIQKIASSHRVVPLDSIQEAQPYGQGGEIRIKLLSALIRLADELDILEERAPWLVKEYLGISEESLVHHNRHEVMTGINRKCNCINISAIAYNHGLEESIKELYNEIIKKFEQVRPILANNKIYIDKIDISVDVNEIVKTELLIFIAEKGEVDDNAIEEEFRHKREISIVDSAFIELKAKKSIISKNGKYLLNDEMKFFKVFIELFIGSKLELRFTKSIYVKKFLEANYTEYVKSKFGVYHDVGDKEDRIQILTHFPTSLEYFIDDRNTPYMFGNSDRRVTLDLGLLHALSVDALEYPDEFEEEVFHASIAISKSLNEDCLQFIKLMQGIGSEKKKRV